VVSYSGNYPPFEIDARESRRQTRPGPGPAAQWGVLPEWEVAQAAPTDWCRTRAAIAMIARAEEGTWTRPNRTKYLESHPDRLPDLTRYWSAVPGFGSPAAAQAAARRSARDEPNWPWSAAFICFVMRSAGIQQSDGFEFSRRHITYIVGALRNREGSDHNRPFWLVDDIELQVEAVPQVGDLLCFNRPDNPPGQPVHWTQYCAGGNQNRDPRGASHCRIVVGCHTEPNGSRFVETIGGNETNSVRLQRVIPVDQYGGIPNPQAHHIFGMIKLIRC
jgi:hypothetical protein